MALAGCGSKSCAVHRWLLDPCLLIGDTHVDLVGGGLGTGHAVPRHTARAQEGQPTHTRVDALRCGHCQPTALHLDNTPTDCDEVAYPPLGLYGVGVGGVHAHVHQHTAA